MSSRNTKLNPSAARFRRFTRAVFAAHAAVLKHGDFVAGRSGGTAAQWRTLARLSAGDVTVPAIARATGYSRQAMQRLVDILVQDDLAQYSVLEADMRTQRVDLTRKGRKTLAAMEDDFNRWAVKMSATLSFDQLERTSLELETIATALANEMREEPRKGPQK